MGRLPYQGLAVIESKQEEEEKNKVAKKDLKKKIQFLIRFEGFVFIRLKRISKALFCHSTINFSY